VERHSVLKALLDCYAGPQNEQASVSSGFTCICFAMLVDFIWPMMVAIPDLGHRNIQHTVRYTELRSDRFKGWFED
jgi:hypothetical protein